MNAMQSSVQADPSPAVLDRKAGQETRNAMPRDVLDAWYTIARYVGIPGETAARQAGVLELARVAFVDADALDALTAAMPKLDPPFSEDGMLVAFELSAWRPVLAAITTLTGASRP